MQDKRETLGRGGGEKLANGSWKLRKDDSSQGPARRSCVEFCSIQMFSPIAGFFLLLLFNLPLLFYMRKVRYLVTQ